MGQLGQVDTKWDDIIGELLHVHALAYFAQVEATNKAASHGLNVAYAKRSAELLMSYEPTVFYSFGIPRKIENAGMRVDVKRYIMSRAARDGDSAREIAFSRAAGAQSSAAEHGVFELLQDVEAVSAVKLIAEANARAIPVFHIDSANLNAVLPRLQVASDVITDVRNAVAAGQEVTIPQTNVALGNWDGVGYTIIDPETGAGAYRISGGLNGGQSAEQGSMQEALEDLLSVLGISGIGADFFAFVAKAGVAISQYKTALTQLARFIAVVAIFSTLSDVYFKTNDPFKALGAGLIELVLVAQAAPALASFLIPVFSAFLGPVGSAIALSLIVALTLTLVRNELFRLFQIARRLSSSVRQLAQSPNTETSNGETVCV